MTFDLSNGRLLVSRPDGKLTFNSDWRMLVPMHWLSGSITVPGRSGSVGGVDQTYSYLIATGLSPFSQNVFGAVRATNHVFSIDWVSLQGSALIYSYWLSNENAPHTEMQLWARLAGTALYLDVRVYATYFWQYPANAIEYKLIVSGFN